MLIRSEIREARPGSRPRWAASEILQVLLVETEVIGGQAGTSSLIRTYLGFPRGAQRRRGRSAIAAHPSDTSALTPAKDGL